MSADEGQTTTQAILEEVLQWARGDDPAEPERHVAFVESAEQLGWAHGLCAGQDDLVFAPAEAGRHERSVSYEGALREPGDELLVADELFVNTQDYLATPFLAVVGPTLVRITGEQDYEAYLQDADLAVRQGIFVEQLLHPAIFLTDLCALGGSHPCAAGRLARLYVAESGEVSSAPGGSVLGTTESDVDSLVTAALLAAESGDPCLNAVVPATAIDRARELRPWLSRYLSCIDVLRGLRSQGRFGYQVSGFGHRLVEGLSLELVERPEAPLLLWNDEEFLLCDSRQGRVFRLGSDAARLVELLLVTGESEKARAVAESQLAMDGDVVREALAELAGTFGAAGVELAGVGSSGVRA